VVPAGLVLAWAALVLPWATVRGSGIVGVVDVRGGRLGAALALIGLATVVAAVVGRVTGRSRAAATVVLVLGIAAVAGSAAVMLQAIYVANGIHGSSSPLTAGGGWNSTEHGVGVAVGGVASVAILVPAVLTRSGRRD
jgi:hypothetical protein